MNDAAPIASPEDGARALAAAAALLAALAVALGAFGAHGLEARLSAARLATFETAARYQMYHALGALLLAALGVSPAAGWTLLGGSLLFSGALYLLVLTDTPWLGAVAPLGGLLMIGGWLWAAWRLWQRLP